MNKNYIKTGILVMAVISSVAAILYYKHTVIDPPKHIGVDNMHNTHISEEISSLEMDSLEKQYVSVMYQMHRYDDENLLSKDTIDILMEDMLSKYTPMFIKKCNSAFSQSEWDVPSWSHDFMKHRASELMDQRRSSGDYIIERKSQLISDLQSIVNTIDKYDDAWSLTQHVRFVSINDTKSKVQQAQKYKNDSQLKNCKSLMNSLDGVSAALKKSHLDHLKSAAKLHCSGVSGYDRYLRSLRDVFNNKIAEYINYYGTDREISELRGRLISNQYDVLNSLVKYAINVNHFYDYSSYCQTNTLVYNYIDTYLGGSGDKQSLRYSLSNSSLTESEFYNQKY